jgi:hypothetical protein
MIELIPTVLRISAVQHTPESKVDTATYGGHLSSVCGQGRVVRESDQNTKRVPVVVDITARLQQYRVVDIGFD